MIFNVAARIGELESGRTARLASKRRSSRRFSMGVAIWTPLLVMNLLALIAFSWPGFAASILGARVFGLSLGSIFGSGYSAGFGRISDGEEFSQRLEQIRQYESQLRLKATQLDSVLRETRELDFSESASSNTHATVKSSRGGIGEGDELSFRITKAQPRKRDASFDPKKGSLADVVDYQVRRLRELPIGYPVEGNLSSSYGLRVSPFSRRVKMHDGVDLSTDRNTRVLATGDGVVMRAGYKGSYGNMVLINHGRGYQTVYAHLSRISAKPGDRICRGEAIGWVGTSGHSTGPHVHYEVRIDGRPRNPEPFLNLASLLNLL